MFFTARDHSSGQNQTPFAFTNTLNFFFKQSKKQTRVFTSGRGANPLCDFKVKFYTDRLTDARFDRDIRPGPVAPKTITKRPK